MKRYIAFVILVVTATALFIGGIFFEQLGLMFLGMVLGFLLFMLKGLFVWWRQEDTEKGK